MGIAKRKDLRAEIVSYPDGLGCCIWRLFPEMPGKERDEDIGICWDFAADEIDDIISMLQELKTLEPRIYEEDD